MSWLSFRLKLIFPLLSCGLLGCGSDSDDGGGGGNNNNSQSGYSVSVQNHRVTRLLYDNDGNGTTDAIDVISYNSEGRVISTDYTYTGDGTTDAYNLRDQNALTEQAFLTYDSLGRLVQTSLQRSNERYENSYDFDSDGLLTRSTQEQYNGSGTLLSSVYWTFSYLSGQMSQIGTYLAGDSSPFALTDLTYGSDGLPFTSRFTSSGVNVTSTFTWRSDGQISTYLSEEDGGDSNDAFVFYDGQGRLNSVDWTYTGGSLIYAEIDNANYTQSYQYDSSGRPSVIEYDLGSNGSVDGTITLEWEEAPCYDFYVWASSILPNFTANDEVPYVPGTGYYKTQYCAP